MDSLTHIVLGAAIGEAVLGKRAGNKAPLWGAFAASIPDFDVAFTWLFNPVDALFVHRGFSHSLLFIALLSPLLGFFLSKIHPKGAASPRQWAMLSFFSMLSHIIIDCFNTYGTAILYPFSNIRVAFDSIGIIDFTLLLPLAIFAILILILPKSQPRRRVFAFSSILFTLLFIVITVLNKMSLEQKISNQLTNNGKKYTRIKTAPLPFTNLIWLVLAEDSTGYYYGVFSIFDRQSPGMAYVERNSEGLGSLSEDAAVRKLIRFTEGFYSVSQNQEGEVLLHDLRFGSLAFDSEKWFVFTFHIRRSEKGVEVSRSHPNRSINWENFIRYMKRI